MSQSRIFRKIWHTGSDDGTFERTFTTEAAAIEYAKNIVTSVYEDSVSDWGDYFWIYSEDLYE